MQKQHVLVHRRFYFHVARAVTGLCHALCLGSERELSGWNDLRTNELWAVFQTESAKRISASRHSNKFDCWTVCAVLADTPRKASVPTVRTLAVSPLVMEAAAVSMAACVCACLCDGSAALELRTTRETQVLYSLLYPFPLMSLHQFHAPHGQIRSKSFHWLCVHSHCL